MSDAPLRRPSKNWFEFRDENKKKYFAVVDGGKVAWATVKRRDRESLRYDLDAGESPVELIAKIKKAVVLDNKQVRGLEWHTDVKTLELTYADGPKGSRKKIELLFKSRQAASDAAELIVAADSDGYEVSQESADIWHVGRNAGMGVSLSLMTAAGFAWIGWACDGQVDLKKIGWRRFRNVVDLANRSIEQCGVLGCIAICLGVTAACLVWWWVRCQNRPTKHKAWRSGLLEAEQAADE